MKIQIECTETQAVLIRDALEDWFRLRMGQADHVAQSLADDNFHYDKNDPENRKRFDAYIERRDHLTEVYRALIRINYGYSNLLMSERCLQACDIWEVLRATLFEISGIENHSMILIRGKEPAPVVRAIKEDGDDD